MSRAGTPVFTGRRAAIFCAAPISASLGPAKNAPSATFVSRLALDNDLPRNLEVRKSMLPIASMRRLGKKNMLHNDALPNIWSGSSLCQRQAAPRRAGRARVPELQKSAAPSVGFFQLRAHQFGATLDAFGARAAFSPRPEEDGSIQHSRTRITANSER